MPECIVCKGYYEPDDPHWGTRCQRCHADNEVWRIWQREEPVEQGGLRGLSSFTEPLGFAPFFVICIALGLGLLFVGQTWKEIKFSLCAFAIGITAVLSVVTTWLAYDSRHRLRENELLAQLRNSTHKDAAAARASQQWQIILIALIILGTVLLLAYVLIRFDALWELISWLFLEPQENEEPVQQAQLNRLKKRVRQALPLVHIAGYTAWFPLLTCFLSILSSRQYSMRMNEELPLPIFWQGDLLTEVVRREAEVELGRLEPTSSNDNRIAYIRCEEKIHPQLLRLPPSISLSATMEVPVSPQIELWCQAATWVWDELRRTDDGGIEMKVARQEIYKLPQPGKDSGHNPDPRVRYVVRADPWGRITRIKRDKEGEEN